MTIFEIIAKELNIRPEQVEKTAALMDEGATVPFIARYRKEVTGSLDDTTLRTLSERLAALRGLEKRREEILSLLDAQGVKTPELEAAVAKAATMTELDDIYRPYRPKRKTRASVAREKGLEPLAKLILAQEKEYDRSFDEMAGDYIDAEKGVESAEDALNGACDIIAEDISDRADLRKTIRELTEAHGSLVTRQTGEDPKGVYANYYDFSEPIAKLPGHRILAINRAEAEEVIKVTLNAPSELILNGLFAEIVENPKSPAYPYLSRAVVDGYDRLIAPSIEREIRNLIFDRACEGAIVVFEDNLKHLLLQAPLKGKTMLGLDPGYRTGCKLAVVDPTGKVLDTAVIYPTKPQERIEESARVVRRLIEKYGVDVVAVGNGTASKESEIFIADTIRSYGGKVRYLIVNEAGASVYSASKLGAEEFPDFDATQRSAVSLARRVQDPLAELVKIEPKAIGVGQYQHDMKPARLDEALSGVVEDCVNSVGVDVNTASWSLLSYISGINSASAKNIVKYREENGEFRSRSQLKKVPRIGDKAFEQCAGFLRIPGAKEPLDNTGVHPESYEAARGVIGRFSLTATELSAGSSRLKREAEQYGMKKLAAELGVGEPTLADIIAELSKPGRDIRDSFPEPELRSDLLDLNDLKPDMILTGTVRNVTDFGAFVDIGVHQDGLVHVSQLSDRFVKHPNEVVSIGDPVTVRVLSVDTQKKRISLSMKGIKN